MAPPAIRHLTCAQLDVAEPIFESLRRDYDGFDDWLARAALMRRDAWLVVDEGSAYAALAIITEEVPGEHGLPGKLLQDLSRSKWPTSTAGVATVSSS